MPKTDSDKSWLLVVKGLFDAYVTEPFNYFSFLHKKIAPNLVRNVSGFSSNCITRGD